MASQETYFIGGNSHSTAGALPVVAMQAVFAGHIPTNQEAAEFPEFYFYGRTLAEKGWPLAASLLPSEWLSDNVRFSLSPPPPPFHPSAVYSELLWVSFVRKS